MRLHRRLPGVVEQVAVVEPGGDDVVHEPRASAFSSATPGISPTAAATGASMRCFEVTYAFSAHRARVSSVPRRDSVLVAERDLRLRRAGNLDQRAHDVLVLGISDGVVDLHVVGLDPAHAVVGDAVLFSGCRIDAHELGGDPIGVRHRFLRFRFLVKTGTSSFASAWTRASAASVSGSSMDSYSGLRARSGCGGQRPGPTREERIDRGGVRLGHRSGVQDAREPWNASTCCGSRRPASPSTATPPRRRRHP